VLALSLAAACRAERAPASAASDPGAGRSAARVVVDDAGDTLRLAAPARRIVSLIPASTELLFAIGAGDALVGRSSWCDYPEAAAALADAGDGISPNLERILSLRPDLVVLYRSAQNAPAVERLRAMGVPVFQAATDSLGSVPTLARRFGAVVSREAAADSLVREFERDLGAATVRSAGRRSSVFLLVWDQPPMTVGRGSFLSELMERAGGTNVFGDLTASAGTISVEAVAARDPDVVLVTAAGDSVPAFARRPEWATVRAVRERRFVRAEGSAFNRPSPRAPEAIRSLASQLEGVVAGAGR
jgi:iron complex transport system substrate-binding protein